MSEIESILPKYFQGKTSEEENQQLYQWIQQSPENKKRLFAEKDSWDTSSFHSNLKNYEVAAELELLKKRIVPKQIILRWEKILQIAAILVVTFGLGWASRLVSFTSQPATPLTLQEIFVPKGQVNQVFLADGTRIWINSETTLITPSVFSTTERVVKLNGEAFFEVAKDQKRPFRVEVNGQRIEVLGTSFNVRAYDNSNVIETTLETGQIKLHMGSQTELLHPGEQSLFNKSQKRMVITQVNPVTFSSWKDGRYTFENEDLLEVFQVVERWYDVEITADETYFRDMHFSGVIKRNKDAKHFLELLNLTTPIHYEIKADEIRITKK